MLKAKTLENGLTIIAVNEPRLVAANAPKLREDLAGIIDAGNNRLILDLSGVDFVDSSGLGAIVGALKRISVRGDLVVCGLGQSPAQLFRLTRMDKVFRIFGAAEDAVAALS